MQKMNFNHLTRRPEPSDDHIISLQPWIQDDSFDAKSDCGPQNNNRLTTIIHPDKEMIKKLRLKYGIITGDKRIDPNDSLVEDIQLIDLNFNDENRKAIDSNQILPLNHICCRNNVQNQLIELRDDIRKQLQNLPDLAIQNNDKCLSISEHIFDYIRKQDERLQIINEKIDQLILLQHKSLKIEQQHKIRETQTTTTTTKTKIKQKPNLPNERKKTMSISSEDTPSVSSASSTTSSSSSSTQSYLDQSIEKVRKDLYDSVENHSKKHNHQTKPKRLESFEPLPCKNNDNDKYEINKTSISELNSHVAQNGSHISTSTPKKSKPAKQQPLNHNHNHNYHQMKHPRQLLRTEQSLYIERLASKYCLNDDDDDDDQDNDLIDTYNNNNDDDYRSIFQSKKNSRKMINNSHINDNDNNYKYNKQSPKINYEKFRTNYNRYGLSDLNSSIETRNYLDKYKLYNKNIETKNNKKLSNNHHNQQSNKSDDNDHVIIDTEEDDERFYDAETNTPKNHQHQQQQQQRLIDSTHKRNFR